MTDTQQLKELALDITEQIFDTGAADHKATKNALAFVVSKLKPVFERLEAVERAKAAQDDHINQQQCRVDWLEAANSGLGKALCAAEAEIARRDAAGDKPFAYAYRYAGCETCSGFEAWRDELSTERPAEWMIETGKVTDLKVLYTAAQPLKVVELPLPENDGGTDWQGDITAGCVNQMLGKCINALNAAGVKWVQK